MVQAAFVVFNPIQHARLIMSAYVAAAQIASIAAFVGYFNLVPALHETLTEFGRARSTFKDPKVLGAFLLPAVLYALKGVLTGRAPRALLWSTVLASLVAVAVLAAVQTVPQVAETLGERATFEQSYEVGPEGRFASQEKALDLAATHPLGIGALEFARLHHPKDVHQIYLNRYLKPAGWAGRSIGSWCSRRLPWACG
mgnify:CR=1 FL=1